MIKTEMLELELEERKPVTTEEDEVKDKKVPILEELKIAVEGYRDINNYSKSDHIISDDIGFHMIFGDVGWRTTSRITKD